MATITIQVVAGAQTYTSTRTVSGPHLVRFIAAYKRFLDAPASPSAGLTDSQVVNSWASNVFSSVRDLVLQQETQAAIQASTATITPIDLIE